MAPWLISHCYVLRESEVRKCKVTILPLKFKLSVKFQRFSAINGNFKMLKIVEFPKNSIKMKNFKTFYGSQTASPLKEIIRPPTR